MARLVDNVLVRHPDTGQTVVIVVGSVLPGWAAPLVGRHLLADERGVGDDEMTQAEPAVPVDAEPPRGGPGSNRDAWAAHAASLGVAVYDEMSRDDIAAAVDKRSGYLVEEG